MVSLLFVKSKLIAPTIGAIKFKRNIGGSVMTRFLARNAVEIINSGAHAYLYEEPTFKESLHRALTAAQSLEDCR